MKIDIYLNYVNTRTVEVESFNKLKGLITSEVWGSVVLKDNYRLNKNFKEASLICLDFDEALTLEEAKETFKGYKHIIGTTKSHQIEKVTDGGQVKPACDRFRVVLFLEDKILNLEDHRATVWSLNQVFPIIKDKFDKASAGTTKWMPCQEIVSESEVGLRVQIVKHIPPPPKDTYIPTNPGERGELSWQTKNFLIYGAKLGQWHNNSVRAIMDIRAQGYLIDEARHLYRKASNHFELDHHDEKLLEDIYNREINNFTFRKKKEA